jgi:DNA repair exonuclease SbcCD ATPase subunit
MDQNLIDTIYRRHMASAYKVSAEGTWIDRSALGMALWLALTEFAERTTIKRVDEAAVELQLLGEWLHANVDEPSQALAVTNRARDAIRNLQDRLAAEIDSNSHLQQQLAGAVNGRQAAQEEVVELRQHVPSLEACLVTVETDAARLRQQVASLEKQLASASAIIEALEGRLAQTAPPVALDTPHGNGKTAPATAAEQGESLLDAVGDLVRKSTSLRDDLAHGRQLFAELPRDIRLQLVQEVLARGNGLLATTEIFDVNKPAWMPRARTLTQSFKCKFAELATLQLEP